MVQWDKDSCADAGFLKIDLLGLGMLSAVERCVEEIARVRGERIDLSRIPFDDQQTFRAIRAADTVGVFQIESRAQMQSLLRTRPMNLEDLTIQVAIVRPGPIQGGAVNPYIERRRRLREDPGYEIPYEHPALEPVLRETLGTIIFQDQVMQVAEAFAGFGPGEADGLRRAMSRKRSHEMLARHRERFIAGADAPRRRRRAARPSACGRWSRASPASASPRRTAPPSACSPTSRRGCASTTARSSCARCSTSSRWASTPPTASSTRPRAGASRCSALDVNASQVECTVQDGGVRLGLGYVKGVAGAEARRARGRARAGRPLPQPRRSRRARPGRAG